MKTQYISTVGELIERLQKIDPTFDVAILSRDDGGCNHQSMETEFVEVTELDTPLLIIHTKA